MLMFALELGAGITGYMMRGEVGNMLENRLNDTLREYNTKEDVRRSWDIMQHDVSCNLCDFGDQFDLLKLGFILQNFNKKH